MTEANPSSAVFKKEGVIFDDCEFDGKKFKVTVELLTNDTVRISVVRKEDFSQYAITGIQNEEYIYQMIVSAFKNVDDVKIEKWKVNKADDEEETEGEIVEPQSNVQSGSSIEIAFSYPAFGNVRRKKVYVLEMLEIDRLDKLEAKVRDGEEKIKGLVSMAEGLRRKMVVDYAVFYPSGRMGDEFVWTIGCETSAWKKGIFKLENNSEMNTGSKLYFTKAGLYKLEFTMLMGSNYHLAIRKNGIDQFYVSSGAIKTSGVGDTASFSYLICPNSGDYFDLHIRWSNSHNPIIDSTCKQYASQFIVTKL